MDRKSAGVAIIVTAALFLSGCSYLKGISLRGILSGEPEGTTLTGSAGPIMSDQDIGPTIAEASNKNEIELNPALSSLELQTWTPMDWSLFQWSKDSSNRPLIDEYNQLVSYYNEAVKSKAVDKLKNSLERIQLLKNKINEAWGKDPEKESFVTLYNDEALFYANMINSYLQG